MSGTREKKTLHLTLKKSAFEVMETGEKMVEFRRPSKWLTARLEKKPGKVTFFDGYKKNRRSFTRDIEGIEIADKFFECSYSNGLAVQILPGDIILRLS